MQKTRNDKKSRGSITVEAAIALPIFICAILCIAFFIKLVYLQEMMQHAITCAAEEMASTSYIYHISGLQGINDAARGDGDDSELLQGDIGAIFENLSSLSSNQGQAKESISKLGSDFTTIAKELLLQLARGKLEEGKTKLWLPLYQYYLKKYLVNVEGQDVDKRLKSLNIKNGFSGLNFDESRFFENENNDIDIVVNYKVDVPLPFKMIPTLSIKQRTTVKAWLGGDENLLSQENDQIWSLDNFQRGKKIRALFGANLPETFPVIASFNEGNACMIKSMDTTAASYQNAGIVKKKIEEYIDALCDFKGGEAMGVEVKQDEITNKRLLLILPEDEIDSKITNAIETAKQSASAKGIDMEVIQYKRKNNKEEINN